MADEGHRDEASPQEVWAILRELSASQRETDRLTRENARRIRELDELFNGQWGKLMEALVKGDLVALLKRRGIEVDLVFTNVERNYGGRRWEIDILAVNGAELVAVEVKTTLKVRDVNHYLDTLRQFTELMPDYAGRAVYGAVAYLKADESSDTYAERKGLFVIRATGGSASITNGRDFRPRTFGSQLALGGAR
ncbi:MAG: hypothetical protein OXJ90_06720 [Spirochaetaceae bacterium]|nr:hypothetical protein [Spirochaetaceae bacterium]